MYTCCYNYIYGFVLYGSQLWCCSHAMAAVGLSLIGLFTKLITTILWLLDCEEVMARSRCGHTVMYVFCRVCCVWSQRGSCWRCVHGYTLPPQLRMIDVHDHANWRLMKCLTESAMNWKQLDSKQWCEISIVSMVDMGHSPADQRSLEEFKLHESTPFL